MFNFPRSFGKPQKIAKAKQEDSLKVVMKDGTCPFARIDI
ncbi:MAG: hypothetical protein RI981_817 [Bacteroidota bacterium]|jgi:hypothetical protein